jgi:hypothetical protein
MFAQGEKYLKKIQNKITKNQEGFNGIMGNNSAMDSTFARDQTTNTANVNQLNNNIAQYGTAYVALKKKTENYLNDSTNNYNKEKNYNIFINQSLNQANIAETNQLGCVRSQSVQASLKNITEAVGFRTAYPNNFTNYAEAETACKLWAADSGSTAYALNKDANGTFRCYTGSALMPNMEQYTKPKNLYTVAPGNTTSVQGGLFNNGQIGSFSGTIIDARWNINAMMSAKFLKKYNSTDYSNGPAPTAGTQDWWGPPSADSSTGARAWGRNVWPNTHAWWLSISDHMFVGTMGYFYYIYENPMVNTYKPATWWGGWRQRQGWSGGSYELGPKYPKVGFYIVADDQCELKVNGRIISHYIAGTRYGDYGGGGLYLADMVSGKNVIEVMLVNTGGPGAFVLYAFDTTNLQNVLFTSSVEGWGYTSNPVSNHKSITNAPFDKTNPYGINAANAAPTTYDTCDPIRGGKIHPQTVQASYGKNCSGQQMPAASTCHGYDCSIEGQKCLKDTPGAGNIAWKCIGNKWKMDPPANVRYALNNDNTQYCVSHRGAVDEYGYGRSKLTTDTCDGGNGKVSWSFIPLAEKDKYMIKNQDTNVCLFNNADGRLGVAPCTEAYNDQQWKFIQNGDSRHFQLKSESSNECLYNNSDGRFGTAGCNSGYNDQLWNVLG